MSVRSEPRPPSVESAVRAFKNETRFYHGRAGYTRGHNPGGFDSADIHPMDTHGFYRAEPELVGERDGVELYKTNRGHQWWAVPMADARLARGRR